MSYQALKDCEDYESQPVKEQFSDGNLALEQTPTSKYLQYSRLLRSLLIVLSALLNVILAYALIARQGESHCGESEVAGLTYQISTPFVMSTEFSKDDFLESNENWDTLSFDVGVVALDKDFIKSKSIPESQPFPWDTTKGIYVINAFHSLHCIKAIHNSLVEFQLSKPQSFPFQHIMHCLDTLRLETICNADDTPRYTTASRDPVSGIGQNHKCRDWGKLERFALEHEACYHYFNYTFNAVVDQRQRYVFCQPGSPYTPKVEKYLAHHKGQ